MNLLLYPNNFVETCILLDHAEEQPSILGGEIAGEQGARQAGDTSIAEDGLESSAGVGTRVEGPYAGEGKIAKGIGPRRVTKEHEEKT